MIFKYLVEAKKKRSGDLSKLTSKLKVSKSGYFKFKSNITNPDKDMESFLLISNVFYALADEDLPENNSNPESFIFDSS